MQMEVHALLPGFDGWRPARVRATAIGTIRKVVPTAVGATLMRFLRACGITGAFLSLNAMDKSLLKSHPFMQSSSSVLEGMEPAYC